MELIAKRFVMPKCFCRVSMISSTYETGFPPKRAAGMTTFASSSELGVLQLPLCYDKNNTATAKYYGDSSRRAGYKK